MNEKIHYSGCGICIIQEISTMRFDHAKERYYVLKPVYQDASVIYVPVKSEQLVSKMRPVLTRQEVEALIDCINEIPTVWEDDPAARKSNFEALLRSNECRNLIALIKTLHAYREERLLEGKTLPVVEDTCLREAQRLLYDEFADALNLQPGQVHDYIQSRLT
ncbi:MAG: hypothetical protein IIY70_04860 [Oscillospiraceae bacterium]|nr:hypothetical protein [Oscillospiraceae bacterium]